MDPEEAQRAAARRHVTLPVLRIVGIVVRSKSPVDRNRLSAAVLQQTTSPSGLAEDIAHTHRLVAGAEPIQQSRRRLRIRRERLFEQITSDVVMCERGI